MSHKHLNPSVPDRPKRVAIVLSNPAVSSTSGWPVGFWWSELTHPYFKFTEAGYEVELFSPLGGPCEADAMCDPEDPSGWQAEDVISRGYKHDPQFVKLIENTRPVDDIDPERFDAIVVAGGQGPMFTFEHATNLHAKFTELYEAGRICAALCHGVSLLRYARLPSGEPLVAGRTVTGFANVEEESRSTNERQDSMTISEEGSMRLSAVITVHKYEPMAYDEPPQGPSLVRIHVEESFSGDIEGDGVAEFLQAAQADGSASFVGIERVRGNLARKEGTFVLQDTGTVDGGIVSGDWFVVPGSGTGQLAGLRGTGGFRANLGEGAQVHLDHWFE